MAKQVVKYPTVETVTVCDIDKVCGELKSFLISIVSFGS